MQFLFHCTIKRKTILRCISLQFTTQLSALPPQALGYTELVAEQLGCGEEDRLGCLQVHNLEALTFPFGVSFLRELLVLRGDIWNNYMLKESKYCSDLPKKCSFKPNILFTDL